MTTGNAAAPSALSGATTPIRPLPSPRYSIRVPSAPPTPLTAPQARAVPLGLAGTATTIATIVVARANTYPIMATWA